MTKNSEIISTFANLGFKDLEIRVYLTVLEQGKATVLSLARATGIKRGTVYEITSRLINRGFLKVTFSEKHRFLIAEDPRILVAKFKEYTDSLSLQLPQLLALQNANENKPKITYYEGEDEVWQIYLDTIRMGKPIFSYTSVIDIYNLIDPKKIDEYIRRRVEKRIPVRIIALESEVSKRWAKREKEELREIRLIPKETYNFSADVEIYGNKVAIVSFKEDIFGIVIESEQIAQMQKMAFELMWKGSHK